MMSTVSIIVESSYVPLTAQDRERLLGVALSLAGAVDYKGGYRAHSQTVGALARGIGERLGVTNDEHLFRLNLAGLLHDVGKLQIPDRILLKPGRLDEAEYEKVKQHPLLGHQTLVALGLRNEARWVLHHHERGDGDGYPSGLIGDQIPLGSRILLACDAWECMTAHRPYQAGLTIRAAAREMRTHVGDQFDADVVDALLDLVRTARPTLATAV